MGIYPILSLGLLLISFWIPPSQEVAPTVSDLPELPQVEVVMPELPPDQFHVVMETTTFSLGTKVAISDATDQVAVGVFSPNQTWLYPLISGRYTVTVADSATTFQLEDNASITNVTGCGWSDGEILHIENTLQWVILLKGATAGTYRLSDGQAQWEQQGAGTLAFPNLHPGTFTLLLPDSTTRILTLTETMPQITLGLH